jgi:primosomal protein N' (replication factor Y) (superfamily II helicase)
VSSQVLSVVLDAPLDTAFDYLWVARSETEQAPQPGQLVLAPFGRRQTIGLVIAVKDSSEVEPGKLRELLQVRGQMPPLSDDWIALCRFAAEYYQRPLGEVALPSLPKGLRTESTVALDRALKKLAQAQPQPTTSETSVQRPQLNTEQQTAVDAILSTDGYQAHQLFGVTGSGKTEVYLHATERVLQRERDAGRQAQVLIMVPEINLTPQLEASVRARFPALQVVSLHSQLAEGERLRHWLAAHLGSADIVLGTRLAVLSSMPHLKMIIIDEEHDPSYKQQEGLRYSARDLAVWRAHQQQIPVVLGSATPSAESWLHVSTGRYQRLTLTQRAAKNAQLPKVRVIDTEINKAVDGFSPLLLAALKLRLERGEQSLLFLNRRGYAPVMHCDACGWISNCRRCTAFMVLHKPERRLRCHHCSLELRIPSACPTCGNVDLQPLGRGTQRVEEYLQQAFPQARVMRIDADSTRRKGSAQAAFDAVHRGDVDILLGTQMVAKGHDFQRLTLVGVINPDTALFSQDYRAGERLFAQLMQVAGRAGRAAQADVNHDGASQSEVLIQTRYPQHPLYQALLAHDYKGFADTMLAERRSANLPPYSFQALLRAEAKNLQLALDFLAQARTLMPHPGVSINDPVPMTITRVAGIERAQLLLESTSRAQLQAFLRPWMQALRSLKTRVNWMLEVDPIDI